MHKMLINYVNKKICKPLFFLTFTFNSHKMFESMSLRQGIIIVHFIERKEKNYENDISAKEETEI